MLLRQLQYSIKFQLVNFTLIVNIIFVEPSNIQWIGSNFEEFKAKVETRKQSFRI